MDASFILPAFWGVLASVILYITGCLVKRSYSPFALARSVDGNMSASLLQFLVFTYITVFSYVAVFIARICAGLDPLTNVPLNLLILMGFSVASATASKGIVISYMEQGQLPKADNSGPTKDKDGKVDLTKVQMLIWTFITCGIYLVEVYNFIVKAKYQTEYALPNVDGALLVLVGVSQGGYIGGKLVSRNTSSPIIQEILPSSISASTQKITIIGALFGDSPNGNSVIYQSSKTKIKQEVNNIPTNQWTDKRIDFDVPAEMREDGSFKFWVNSGGQLSNDFEVLTKK